MWVKSFCACFLLLCAFVQAEITPEQALQKLLEGNQRYISDTSTHPNRSQERREETAIKQKPYAVILGCSDSRVSPEILFDQGIGDLFIVRVAGNVVGPIGLASIEYAALYLHSCVIVVLGHESCGAVNAVIEGQSKDIEAIADLIQPAVKKTANASGNRLENAVKANVQQVVEELQQNPALKALIDKKALLIKGGYYNFHSGKVEIL